MNNNNTYWYVVYTRPRWEKKVASFLAEKGINYYCPLNKVMKQWSDRKKLVLEPLFKGYVFVQVAEDTKWELLNITGIVNFVYWLKKPAKIKDSEIDTIRIFLNEFKEVEVSKSVLSINDTVRIKNGVLMNYQGILVEMKGNKVKVRIESMGIQLSAFFEKRNIQSIHI